MSGEERCKSVGMSGLLSRRRSEEMTQSNTSSSRELEVPFESFELEVPLR